jgi:hypothetical protein
VAGRARCREVKKVQDSHDVRSTEKDCRGGSRKESRRDRRDENKSRGRSSGFMVELMGIPRFAEYQSERVAVESPVPNLMSTLSISIGLEESNSGFCL